MSYTPVLDSVGQIAEMLRCTGRASSKAFALFTPPASITTTSDLTTSSEPTVRSKSSTSVFLGSMSVLVSIDARSCATSRKS